MLTLAALTVAAYFVCGTAVALPQDGIAGVVPTLESLRRLAVGVVTSWKGLLTTVAPVGVDDALLIVPFLLTLVAAVVTGSLGLRLRTPGWALIPAVLYLAAQIALGTSQPAAPLLQGIVFAVVATVWLAVRQAWAPARGAVALGGSDGARPASVAGRRLVAGAAVLLVAATAGVAASALASPNEPRYVLRDAIIPPFDVRQYPSPLQAFRGYVRDTADEPLFTVSGLPEGARVRLATMDAYSGTVYNVSDEGSGSSSAFTPLRSEMSPDAVGTPVTLRVEVQALSSVWMPDAGAVDAVRFDGPRAEELRRAAFYNAGTGTAVVTARLARGDAYTLDTTLPVLPSDEQLADQDYADVTMPAPQGVPNDFAERASEMLGEATTPIEKVRALQQTLSQEGFFSHGLEGQVRSRAGHGAERIATMLGADQWVGDDEQYAVAMALLAGQVGIPARVVMGFYPDDDQTGPVFTATGESLHAWVEVAFDRSGWVPFDPTPPEDQVPNDQSTKPRADPQPQVLQPPPPAQQPADLPPTVPDERGAEDDEANAAEILGLVLLIGGVTLAVLVVLLAPFIVIGALKAARRARRRGAARPSDRISGGWDELVDRASDYGTSVRRGGTRGEDAAVLGAGLAAPTVTALADRADAEVFGPSDPTAEQVEEFWREVDDIVVGVAGRAGFWRRLRARLALRSLLAGTRFALPERRRRGAPVTAAEAAGDGTPTRSEGAS